MGKIISSIIVSFLIVAVFMAGTCAIYAYNDEISMIKVKEATNNFQDTVRKKGYISQKGYDDFVKILSGTGNVYDIQMKHIKYIIYPLTPSNSKYTVQKPWIELNDIYGQRYILNVIYKQYPNDYKMNKGDDFLITVVNKNITGTMVFMSFIGGKAVNTIWSQGGGMITSEEY